MTLDYQFIITPFHYKIIYYSTAPNIQCIGAYFTNQVPSLFYFK